MPMSEYQFREGKDRRRAMTGIAADRFTIDASRCIANLRL
jgi:hypothetical protein